LSFQSFQLLDPGLGPSLVGRVLTLGYESGLGFGKNRGGVLLLWWIFSSLKWESLYPNLPDLLFLILGGRRDGTFWVIAGDIRFGSPHLTLPLWLDQMRLPCLGGHHF